MTTDSQFEVALCEIAQLLEQQRYEEALSALTDLLDENPSHREARTYRLLVVRILVLRHYLSRRPWVYKRALDRVADAVSFAARALDHRKVLNHLAGKPEAQRSTPARHGLIRITLALVFCAALITFLTMIAWRDENGNQKTLQSSTFSLALAAPAEAVDHQRCESGAATGVSGPGEEPAIKKMLAVEAFEPARPAVQASGLVTNNEETASRVIEAFGAETPPPVSDRETMRTGKPSFDARARKFWPPHETLRAVSLRRSARFGAPIVREIDSGSQVKVLEVRGSWARVVVQDENVSGFVRKEFLMSTAERG
ncbi:MAG TPA: SH3 domain-containing protein [Candidatus Eisenbacteria bacterium]|nr:SH3 domain-containing protein [Candidatus Eisenbacteria bacterium]